MAETAGAAFGVLEGVDHPELTAFDALDDQLSNPVTPMHLIGRRRIRVHQQDPEFIAETGVDQAWRVQARNSMPECKAAPRLDEAGKTVRQRQCNASGNERPSSTRGQHDILTGHQIGTGITNPGVAGKRQIGVQYHDGHIEHD